MKLKYQAKDAQGQDKSGIVDAPSNQAALESLRNQGLFPTVIVPLQQGQTSAPACKITGKGYQVPNWALRRDDGQVLEYRQSHTKYIALLMLLVAVVVMVFVWRMNHLTFRIFGTIIFSIMILGCLAYLSQRAVLRVDTVTRQFFEHHAIGPFSKPPIKLSTDQITAVIYKEDEELTPSKRPSSTNPTYSRTMLYKVILKLSDGATNQLESCSSQPHTLHMAEKLSQYLQLPLLKESDS